MKASAVALALLPLAAVAAGPSAPAVATPNPAAGFAQVLLSLVLILAVIVALAWVATRLKLTPRAASKGLAVLADVAVGPKERVLLLKVGEAQALIGVGADGVRSLRLLERVVELPPESPPGAFAERLKSLMGPGAGR